MKRLNLVLVYNKNKDKILMCKRTKEPYIGKFNLVGGKVEENEDVFKAAYRELEEETGISSNDIELNHVMNFQYIVSDIQIEILFGILNKDVTLIEEANPLFWISTNENFFDLEKYAGEGNIGHMVEQVKLALSK